MPRKSDVLLPEWKLERYLLGDLAPADKADIQRHLAGSTKEQKRLEALEKEFAAVRMQYPFRKLFPNQRKSAAGFVERLRALLSSRAGVAFALVPLLLGLGIFIFSGKKELLNLQIAANTPESEHRIARGGQHREKDIVSANDEKPAFTGGDIPEQRGRFNSQLLQDGDKADTPYSERIVRDSLALGSKQTKENFDGAGFTPEGPAGTEASIPRGYKDRDYQKAQYGKKNTETRAQVERKIIRTGNIFAEVPSVKDALAKVKTSLAALGGHVENENISKDANDHAYANLTLRIPAARFDEFMGSSGSFGKILNQSSHAQDATREYFDTELRLKNDLELKNRLITVLRTRAGKLSDILELETELARVTERIELSKGSLRYLDAVAGMSRIDLQLKEPDSVMESGRPGAIKQIAGGFGRAWYLFTDLITFAITSLGVLVPLALFCFGLWKLYRRYRRRHI